MWISNLLTVLYFDTVPYSRFRRLAQHHYSENVDPDNRESIIVIEEYEIDPDSVNSNKTHDQRYRWVHWTLAKTSEGAASELTRRGTPVTEFQVNEALVSGRFLGLWKVKRMYRNTAIPYMIDRFIEPFLSYDLEEWYLTDEYLSEPIPEDDIFDALDMLEADDRPNANDQQMITSDQRPRSWP